MNITLAREVLLKPLQLVFGAVEKRQTLPILSHILFSFKQDKLWLTATDLEIELVGHVALPEKVEDFEVTVSARKLVDICRSLPDQAEINLTVDNNRFLVRSGRSRFTLATLPAQDFPKVGLGKTLSEFSISQNQLRFLLEKTYFAMAQQDVRYYLNGMLFDIQKNALQVVATDGHRLALSLVNESFTSSQTSQLIVPRKAILELIRLLSESEESVAVAVSSNHLHVTTNEFVFTSKLMDGKFPDFNRVIPKNADKEAVIDRDLLKQALSRVAILCNEKYHSVRVLFDKNAMLITANNPEQEEAEEELEISYAGERVEIGFNVNYLLDVLNVLPSGGIQFSFLDSNSSVLLKHVTMQNNLYVVMPMRL